MSSPCWRRVASAVAFVMMALASSAAAQGPTGRLIVTVVDMTGAVLPGATVTVTPATAAQTTSAPTGVAAGQRVGTIDRLPPGRYTIRAELPGVQPGTFDSVNVRTGDNRQTLTLSLEKLQDSVAVTQERQTAAADPRGSSFGTAL